MPWKKVKFWPACSYHDQDSGFYYLKGRYYDPIICRFVNADGASNIGTNSDFASVNLFTYCGNNPTSRADDGGEFWHIVAGAVGGALISGVVQVASNILTGKNWSDDLVTSVLTGAASGALAASGVGLIGSIAGNAAIAMAGNATNQVVKNNGFGNFDVGDLLLDGAIGAVAGAAGGSGASKGNAKSAMTLGRQLSRRINKTGEIGLALSYYAKNMMTTGGKSIYRNLNVSLIRGGVASLFAKTAKKLFHWGGN